MRSLRFHLTLGGIVYAGAMLAMAVSKTPLGSTLYFTLTAVAGVVYVSALVRVWRAPMSRALFFSALAFAVRHPRPQVGRVGRLRW